jgi:hypothetical protein
MARGKSIAGDATAEGLRLAETREGVPWRPRITTRGRVTGTLLGGTYVAVCMIVAFVGGILAVPRGRSTRIAGIALMAFIPALDAFAQSMPNFDTDSRCRNVASGSSYLEGACRDNEEVAKDWMKRMKILPEIWQYCTKLVGSGHSYALMKDCIQSEESDRKSLGR